MSTGILKYVGMFGKTLLVLNSASFIALPLLAGVFKFCNECTERFWSTEKAKLF